MLGQTLNSRYTITARLGKGAMGAVYRALDKQTEQEVAVKVIARELALDVAMLERFRREGEALRQLRHPNIAGFIDMFEFEEQHVIVMEYVPGGNLHQLLKQGPLPLDRCRRVALELCDALARALAPNCDNTQCGFITFAGLRLEPGQYDVRATWPRADGNPDPRSCTLTVVAR